jgi:hypothetical protein
MEGRACTKCRESKTLDEFPLGRRKTKSGVTTYLRGECKDCRRTQKNEWTRNNKDKVAQNFAKHRDKVLANRRQKYREHHEAHLVEMRKYYQDTKEMRVAKSKEARESVSDSYARALLLQDAPERYEIPQALVETKKLQLKIWRMTHEKRK